MRRRERAAYEKGYQAGLEDSRRTEWQAEPVEFTPHPCPVVIHIPQPEYDDYDAWSD